MEKNICGSTETATGKPCQLQAGWGTDHRGEGLCSRHNQSLLEKYDIEIDNVKRLAAVGMTMEQIGLYYGISHDTFARIQDRHEIIMRSYKKGRSQGISTIAKTLWQKAKNGNITAIIFYLKTQANWSEDPKLADSVESLEPKEINIVVEDAREKE